MLLFFLLALLVLSSIVRLFVAPFWYSGLRRRGWYGYRYNPYRYGCRRHHGLLGRLLPIIVLVAVDRLFGPHF